MISRAFTIFVFLLIFAASAFAAPDPVYVVDVQKIIRESKIGIDARERFEKEATNGKAKLEKLRAELKNLYDGFEKQKSVLAKEALIEKQKEALQKKDSLEAQAREIQQGLSKKQEDELNKVVAQIKKATLSVGEEMGAKLIFDKDELLVVYVTPQYEITDKVLEKVDQG